MANPFRKSSDWLRFALAIVLSISVMVIDARTSWLDSSRSVMSVVLNPVQTVAALPSTVGRFISNVLSAEPNIKIAYENLRNEYFQLKSETLLLRSLQEENDSLRSLLDASDRLNEKVTLAELVNVSIDPYNHRILVNRGLRHKVYVGQAAIDDQGVIGQVTEVLPFKSGVMLITDPGHAMPVQVKRTGLRTVIYGTGSVSLLKIPFLNQNSDIKIGDELYSSGIGGRFPRGYPVAKITDVQLIPDEAFMKVSAKPIAQLDGSNHVLLLSRTLKPHFESVDTLESSNNSESELFEQSEINVGGE